VVQNHSSSDGREVELLTVLGPVMGLNSWEIHLILLVTEKYKKYKMLYFKPEFESFFVIKNCLLQLSFPLYRLKNYGLGFSALLWVGY
jgi:hypothetical protein